jgi:hypothetical protein
MKALKMLAVLLVLSSLLPACEKWKDIIHKEKDKDKVLYTAKDLPMTGAQENPQKTTPAEGLIDVEYDKRDRYLNFTLKWAKLTGNPTGAHIHGIAPRGMNAGIKFDFFSLFPKTTSGVFKHSVLIDGITIKEDSLLKGYYYFNIHTPTNPGGEIRGQIEFK